MSRRRLDDGSETDAPFLDHWRRWIRFSEARIIFWFLRKRLDVLAEADEFIESFGEYAYQEARYELAKAFERGDKPRMKFLERVSKEIAKRTDFEPEPSEQEPYTLGANKGARIH